MRVTRSRSRWVIEGFFHALMAPRMLAQHLQMIYGEAAATRSAVPVIDICDFLGTRGLPEIALSNFTPENKNISTLEMSYICALTKATQPRTVLELGTFNGNTTLQIALNAPDDARLFTVDLRDSTSSRLHESGEKPRRFVGAPCEPRIRQIYGDSLHMDFSSFCEGRPVDLAFIDAGHSYECVRNDTEKTLPLMAPGGLMIWHDFAYNCAGVFNYLNELAGMLPIANLSASSLVVYRIPV